MTLRHINWHQSEVMRELERQQVKRGYFDPKPDEIVKSAAHVTNVERYEPTGNIYNDIMILARGLKSKGFDKQAEELEKKAVALKLAEKHLYRVHDEDGEDLLDFAYPDGDVEIAPSKDNLGKVWTPQSQQKAILDVVKKQPKKNADISQIAQAIQIVAQQPVTQVEQIREENQKKVNELFDGLKKYIKNYVRPGLNKFGNFDSELNNISNKLNITLGLDASAYNEAIQKINNSINELNALQNKVAEPAAGDMAKYTGYVGLQSAIRGYGQFAENTKLSISKLIPGLSGQQMRSQDRPIDAAKVSEAIEYYKYASKLWANFLTKMQQEGDAVAAKGAADNVTKSSGFVNFLSMAVERSYTLLRLIKELAPMLKIQSEDELVQHAKEWVLNSEREIQRVAAGISSDFIKLSQTTLTPIQRSTGPKKTTQAPTNIERPSGLGEPGAGLKQQTTQQTTSPESTEEKQTVSLMQQVMADLAKGLIAKQDQLFLHLEIQPQQITTLANTIADTGGQQTFDGKWGQKTNQGLQAVNKLIQVMGESKSVDVGLDFRQDSPEAITAAAKKNTDVIASLAGKLGLSQYIKAVEVTDNVTDKVSDLDYISRDLSGESLRAEEDHGEIGVTEKDLQSLPAFYSFLESLSPSVSFAHRNDALTKAAQEIVDPWAEEKEQGAGLRRISVEEFSNALRWFFNRSRIQLSEAQRMGDAELAKRKQNYLNYIHSLAQDWFNKGIRTFFEQRGDYVDPMVLSGIYSGRQPEQAVKTRREQGAGYERQRPEYGASVENRRKQIAIQAIKNPPFLDGRRGRQVVDLAHELDFWCGSGGESLRRYLTTTLIRRNNWRGITDEIIAEYAPESVQNIIRGRDSNTRNLPEAAKKYMADRNNQLPGDIWVRIMGRMIIRAVSHIFNCWYEYVQELPDSDIKRDVINRMARERSEWIAIMTSAGQ